ncbi:MAG: hypothetical protein AB8G14_14970 [Ilumatobacter sp.]
MMFAPFCPTHDTEVLMTRRNVLSFWNGPDGPFVRWKCNCGHEGTMGPDGSIADPVERVVDISIRDVPVVEMPVPISAHAVRCTA